MEGKIMEKIIKLICISGLFICGLSACNQGGNPSKDSVNEPNNLLVSDNLKNVSEQLNGLHPIHLVGVNCGIKGVDNLILTEGSGSSYQEVIHLGDSRGIRAKIKCKNKTEIDVTPDADWASNNNNVFTVSNSKDGALSKGTISPKSVGDAYLNVVFDKYSVKAKVSVSDAVLRSIKVSSARGGGEIAKGETISVITEGVYGDGTSSIISNPELAIESTTGADVIKLNDNSVTGLNKGDYAITAKYQGMTAGYSGKVLPAKIVGLKIIDDNIKLFTTGIPKTEKVNAKLLLSDGSLINIPDSTFENPTTQTCQLYKLPTDTMVPFVNVGSKCEISSTSDAGENILTYRYAFLDDKGSIDMSKPTFESKIVIKSSDDEIDKIELKTNLVDTMTIGDVYRYNVYADLKGGGVVDITKVIPLNLELISNAHDYSNKVSLANTGYVGTGDGKDDGKGGVIKLNDSFIKNDMAIKEAKLNLSVALTKFHAVLPINLKVMSNVITEKALASYFVDNVYGKLNSREKMMYIPFYGYNESGSIKPLKGAKDLFGSFNDDQLIASKLDDKNPTLWTESSSGEITPDVDINTPRISSLYSDENPIATVLCNYSATNQNGTTASISKSVTDTSTFGRGFSVGTEVSGEFAVGILLAKGKTTIKVSGSYNQSWSWAHAEGDTYTLPSQSVLLPPHAKALVIQRIFRSNVAYTGDFSVPLNQNSCIPYLLSAKAGGGYLLSSEVCLPFNQIDTSFDPFLSELFTQNMRMVFHANLSSDTALNDGKTNTVAQYVYNVNDPGYDGLKCSNTNEVNSQQIINKPSVNQLNGKLSSDNLSFVTVDGVTIPLNDRNLISMKTNQGI